VFPLLFDEMMRGMQSTSTIEASPRTGCISILFKEQVNDCPSVIQLMLALSAQAIIFKKLDPLSGSLYLNIGP